MKFLLKSSLIFTCFFLLNKTSFSQSVGDCPLTDPLFDYEPEEDWCCPNSTCYDIYSQGAPWDDIAQNGPFQFNGIVHNGVFLAPQGTNTFSSYEELSDLIDDLCAQNGISVNFIWNENTGKICAYNTGPGFDYLYLCCDPISGCADPLSSKPGKSAAACFIAVPAVYNESDCPFSEPDFSSLLDPANATFDPNLIVFNDVTLGDIHDNITANPTSGPGPDATSVAVVLGELVESGALPYGATCFNLNCIDLPSLANQFDLNSPLLDEVINSGLPLPDGYSNWADFFEDIKPQLETQLANIDLIDFVNANTGWNWIDMGDCPTGEGIEIPVVPFTGNSSSDKAKGQNAQQKFLNGISASMAEESGAEGSWFDQLIPGLGVDKGGSTPSPSAMAMIQGVKGGVNLYNGSQSTSVPLYTFVSNDISVPIAISSSNNGLKVNDIGTLVGQNWQLDAGGMISRVVNGLPDEYDGLDMPLKGTGVGRNYKLKPRLEIPSNIGISIKFPKCEDAITTQTVTKNTIINGFEVSNVESKPTYLVTKWSPLQPNILNFTVGVLFYKFLGVEFYIEVSFNAGIVVNEKLGKIHYEERGLGYLHTDDNSKLQELGVNIGSSSSIYPLYNQSKEVQTQTLRSIHSVKRVEDDKFFNDHVASWSNYIEAIKDLVGVEIKYQTKKLDTQPDEFYYNFGSYSGKFLIKPNEEIVTVPYQKDLAIVPFYTPSGERLAGFEVTTPEGFVYTFGKSDLTGVDLQRDTSYYLPNFYVYPESGTSPEEFDKAKIDMGQIHYMPFIGRRYLATYGNTYERNYKIMEGPEYTSAWHLTSIRSLITDETVSFSYDKREISYYTNKSYSHTFPNFDINGNGNLSTTNTNGLNPLNGLFKTKWEFGRSEFSYSVTQTSIKRWHLTGISSGRGERVDFIYDCSDASTCGSANACVRGEIPNDYLLGSIKIYRNNTLYKGWKFGYEVVSQEEASAFCNSETSGSVPQEPVIGLEGETKWSLGEIYEPVWFEYYDYLYVTFKLCNFPFPIRIPLPYDISSLGRIQEMGYRTEMTEYGSLMEVKALNKIYYQNREQNIFNAEKKRSFLKEICEIDKTSDLHPFITIEYENNGVGIPKRFSTNQDVFGYNIDNSLNGSPFPPVAYTSISGQNINSTFTGAEKLYGFYNLNSTSSSSMRFGQAVNSDVNLVKIGAISKINFESGASISYEYELNQLIDNNIPNGAGLRVKKLVEDPGTGIPKVTDYFYFNSTTVWGEDPIPVRIYQSPYNYYARFFYPGLSLGELNSSLDGIFEQKVLTTSSWQNKNYPNRGAYVGYGQVREQWDGVGYIDHYFTTPANYFNYIHKAFFKDSKIYLLSNLGARIDNFDSEIFNFSNPSDHVPPSLRLPENHPAASVFLGVEYKRETYNADGEMRQEIETLFGVPNTESESTTIEWVESEMFQYNHFGTRTQRWAWRKIPQLYAFYNYLKYGYVTEEEQAYSDLIEFFINVILGSVVDHPYKRVHRNYFIVYRTFVAMNFRVASKTIIDYYENEETTTTTTNYLYGCGNTCYPSIQDSPNPFVPRRVTTTFEGLSDTEKLEIRTDNYFASDDPMTETELQDFEPGALDHLNSFNYNAPLFSRVFLDGVLYKEDFTSLGYQNQKIIPLNNWTLRDGMLHKAGSFTDWNIDGKPTNYEIYTFDQSGQSTITYPYSFQFAWNNQLQLTSKVYGGMSTSNQYNGYFELISSTDKNSIASEFEYDSRGRLSKVRALNNRQETSYSYNIEPGNNFISTSLSFTDGSHPTQVVTQYMDGFGKELSQIRENDGAVLTKTLYDSYFRPVAKFEIKSGQSTISYEASPLPRVTTVVDAEGNSTVTKNLASPYFLQTNVTDANGHTTQKHIDGLERVRMTVLGEGGVTKYFYDTQGRLDFIENPVGEIFNYRYNLMDKVIGKTIPGADEYKYWFDERFRLAAMEDGNGDVMIYEYDVYDRLTGTYHYPDGLFFPEVAEGIVNSSTMDNYFNPQKRVQENQYDGVKSWLVYSKEKVFSPDNDSWYKETTNVNNDIGQVLNSTISYPHGNVTIANDIDDAGLLNSMSKSINPVSGTQLNVTHSYTFDDVLRPELTYLDNDLISKLEYNAKDLVRTKFLGQWVDDVTNDEVFLQKVDYFYDNTGRLIRINNPSTSECTKDEQYCTLTADYCVRTNNNESQICTTIDNIDFGNGQFYSLNPPIDLQNPTASASLRDAITGALDYFGYTGVVTVNSFKLENEICYEIRIENTNAPQIAFLSLTNVCFSALLEECCVRELNRSSGVAASYPLPPNQDDNYDIFFEKIEYDGLDISRIEYYSDCRTGKFRNDFTYDKNHRIVEMKNAIFEPERKDDRYSTTYTYDQAGNIITLTRRGMITPPGSNDPQYGLIDNLLYEYDISNPGVKRLTSVDDLLQGPTQAYGFEPDIMQTGYDNNGNMLSNENGSVEWSVINMPFSATLSDGTMKFDYTYTGEKIKVERTGPDGEQRLYLAGAEYVFDTETSTWVLDNYQFEEGRKQYITDEYPQDPKPAVIQYQITDHLGNLAVLFSDANGDGHISSETEAVENGEDPEIIQRMYYYPFGMPMQGNWTNTTQYQDRYTYNHKEQVTGIEWFAYGARYYDAKIGRFAGVDPLGEEYASISTYSYVANNPLNSIDPDGKKILFVNGHYQANWIGKWILGSYKAGKDYWGVGFTSAAQKFFGDYSQISKSNFIDGSSSIGIDMSGADRYKYGYEYAKENIGELTKGMSEGETFKIVTHSEGAAYGAGIAQYLLEQGYEVEEVVHLSADEGDEFSTPIEPITFQLGYYGDWVTGNHRIKGVDKSGIVNSGLGFQFVHGATRNAVVFKQLEDLRNVQLQSNIGLRFGRVTSWITQVLGTTPNGTDFILVNGLKLMNQDGSSKEK